MKPRNEEIPLKELIQRIVLPLYDEKADESTKNSNNPLSTVNLLREPSLNDDDILKFLIAHEKSIDTKNPSGFDFIVISILGAYSSFNPSISTSVTECIQTHFQINNLVALLSKLEPSDKDIDKLNKHMYKYRHSTSTFENEGYTDQIMLDYLLKLLKNHNATPSFALTCYCWLYRLKGIDPVLLEMVKIEFKKLPCVPSIQKATEESDKRELEARDNPLTKITPVLNASMEAYEL
ncbi:MAG: hypothetical protein AAGG80_05285, partial [Pseudomonadota bacterium]